MKIQQDKLLKLGLYSNSVYILLLCLFTPNGMNITNISITGLFLFSAIAIYLVCIKNWKRIHKVPKGIRMIFYVLFFWGCIIIVRSFSFSIKDWVTNFGNIYMAFAWLLPITMVLGLKIKNWNIVFKTIFFMFSLMIVAFILLPFFNYNEYWVLLLRPINFVILIGIYHFSLIRRLNIYLIIILYFFAIIFIASRRVDQLFFAMILLFILLDKVSSVKIKKQFLIYILLGFVFVFFLTFTIGYEFVASTVTTVVDYKDSRTFLFQELMSDLSFKEKIFGRGSLGTYYSGFFEKVTRYYKIIGNTAWKGDDPTRITVEVGYLQMILKGGFILLLLNFIIFIYASYLAIFKSRSKFIRRLGYFILTITILMLIEFRPTFTPIFIIFWMAIGTVLNKTYREMSNEDIQNVINL